jgi:hypothetical protein
MRFPDDDDVILTVNVHMPGSSPHTFFVPLTPAEPKTFISIIQSLFTRNFFGGGVVLDDIQSATVGALKLTHTDLLQHRPVDAATLSLMLNRRLKPKPRAIDGALDRLARRIAYVQAFVEKQRERE